MGVLWSGADLPAKRAESADAESDRMLAASELALFPASVAASEMTGGKVYEKAVG